MKKYILPFVLLIILFSCKKNQTCDYWGYKFPYVLSFIVKSNSVRLPDNVLNSLKMYYIQNNTKKYITDFIRYGKTDYNSDYNLGVMLSQEVGFISADKNIKDFYLEFPEGDIDTLFIDYKHLTLCEALKIECQTLYPRIAVRFNNQIPLIDSSGATYLTYSFNK